MEDDTPLIHEIKERLRKINEKKTDCAALLTLTIRCSNGKQYETTLKVRIWEGPTKNSTTDRFRMLSIETEKNDNCISIKYVDDKDDHLDTIIRANIGEPACFRPRLTSDPSDQVGQLKTTDVLQVLKTKLCLMLPVSLTNGIQLTDTMFVHGVDLTAFRLLRGGWPYYWKYGYHDPFTVPFRKYLAKLDMDELRLIEKYMETFHIHEGEKDLVGPYTYLEKALAAKGIVPTGDDMLSDIMKNFSFEDEQKQFQGLSKTVLNAVETDYDFRVNEYVLDESSAEWNEWRRRVVITGYTFTELPSGGRRKRRTRRNIHKRRRMKSRRHIRTI